MKRVFTQHIISTSSSFDSDKGLGKALVFPRCVQPSRCLHSAFRVERLTIQRCLQAGYAYHTQPGINSDKQRTLLDKYPDEIRWGHGDTWVRCRCKSGEHLDNTWSREHRSKIYVASGYDRWAFFTLLSIGVTCKGFCHSPVDLVVHTPVLIRTFSCLYVHIFPHTPASADAWILMG